MPWCVMSILLCFMHGVLLWIYKNILLKMKFMNFWIILGKILDVSDSELKLVTVKLKVLKSEKIWTWYNLDAYSRLQLTWYWTHMKEDELRAFRCICTTGQIKSWCFKLRLNLYRNAQDTAVGSPLKWPGLTVLKYYFWPPSHVRTTHKPWTTTDDIFLGLKC